MRVTWSMRQRDDAVLEGWKVDAKPGPARQDGAVGALDVRVEEPEARALVFHRRLDIKKKELGTTAEFKELQGLFAGTRSRFPSSAVSAPRAPHRLDYPVLLPGEEAEVSACSALESANPRSVTQEPAAP